MHFTGPNGPARGSPPLDGRTAAFAARVPRWHGRPLRALTLAVVLAVLVVAMRLADGESIDTFLHLATLYYVFGTLGFVTLAWVVVFVVADKAFALVLVTIFGGVLLPSLLLHHPVRRLVLDPGPARVVRGAFRQIKGSAPAEGYVTVAPVDGPGRSKRLHVGDSGRFSTAVRVDLPEETFLVKYFDGSGLADDPADEVRQEVFTTADHSTPVLRLRGDQDGPSWTVIDNSGAASVDLSMRRPGRAPVATWSVRTEKNRVRMYPVVPLGFSGEFVFCARARDRAGNASRTQCLQAHVGSRTRGRTTPRGPRPRAAHRRQVPDRRSS
jgi:hypothetical protein